MDYTKLDEKDISTILQHYGVDHLTAWKVLGGGSENSNYYLACDQDQFVLTICEQKSFDESRSLAQLLEYLGEQGFSTSKIIRDVHGQLISEWKNKPVILKRYLEGEIIEDFSNPTLELIGHELAKLHKIKAPDYVQMTFSYGQENFDEIETFVPESSFAIWLNGINKYIKPFMSDELPSALIHTDLFFNNIIVNGHSGAVTIMDFEEATHYSRVFDLGMTIVGTCCYESKVDAAKTETLLLGYQKGIKLESIEKKALKPFTVYAAAATAFWRFKNFRFTNPNSQLKDHYLEMKDLADHILSLPDTFFIEMVDK